jgi:hypothetical protein
MVERRELTSPRTELSFRVENYRGQRAEPELRAPAHFELQPFRVPNRVIVTLFASILTFLHDGGVTSGGQ